LVGEGPGGAGAEAPAWTPLDLDAKLWAFYDPKDAGSITQSGGVIDQIDDLSGNARHLTAALTVRPAYNATGFGASQPSMDFDGSNDVLATTSEAFGTSAEFVFATVAIIDSSGGADMRVASLRSTSDINDFANATSAIAGFRNGGAITLSGYRTAARAGGTITNATRFRMISQWDGSNHTMTIDGSAATSADTGGNFGATVDLYVGSGFDASVPTYFWKGKIGPVVVCNDSLTAGEKTSLDAWLAAW
jgi:hypothetical protein